MSENLLKQLENMTLISGFAIGASAIPGEFYSLVKKIFEFSPDHILSKLKTNPKPIMHFVELICQYRFYPSKEIENPWSLLRNTTLYEFQPFGCGKYKKTIGEIVWLHLNNINYLGLFNDFAKPTLNVSLGSIKIRELPLYPEFKLKSIAYSLLITETPFQIQQVIIDWLKSVDDIYGYLEHEPEYLLQQWQSNPFNLSQNEIKKLVEILISYHPNPDLFKNRLKNQEII